MAALEMKQIRLKVGAVVAAVLIGSGFAGVGTASACISLDACPHQNPIQVDELTGQRSIVIDFVSVGVHDRDRGITRIAIDHVGAGLRGPIDDGDDLRTPTRPTIERTRGDDLIRR